MKIFVTFFFLTMAKLSLAQWPFKEEAFLRNAVSRHYDPKLIGGGVAIFDFDNDGWQDLYFTGGLNNDKLFHNLGNGKFEDVSSKMGILEGVGPFKTVGVASGDLDNDGFADLVVTTDKGEPNLVLRNMGGHSFEVMQPFLNDPKTWSTSVILADCNKDSYLDVYIFNYVEYSQEPYFQWRSNGQQNFFYQNNGGFQFTDITKAAGVQNAGAGLAGTFSDFDDDEDPDLFVINDFGYEFGSNTLLINEFPAMVFSEIDESSPAKAAIDGMGIAIGDYNGDGLLDYYVSNFGENLLLTNQGNSFVEQAQVKNLQIKGEVSWGTFFFDFDNDTYLDLFVANGSMTDPTAKFENHLFHQEADGQFTDVTPANLPYNKDIFRGAAFGDLNNDGALDAVVVVVSDKVGGTNPALLYISHNQENNWFKLKLQGTISNRDAYGAKVQLYLKDRSLLREVDGGSSYLSQNSSVVHVGLGTASRIDSLYINWPNGLVEVYYDLKVNTFFEAVENEGLTQVGLVTGLAESRTAGPLTLTPNPFTDILNVFIGDEFIRPNPGFTLHNVTGQRIDAIDKVENDPPGSFVLHVDPSLKPDLYLLRITFVDRSYCYKIIKKDE